MTIDHPLRRFFARVCSPDTMARVVDPTLADVRWEGRAAWRAALTVMRALIVHAIVSLPGAVMRASRDDDFAVPRIAVWTLAASLLLAAPLVAPMAYGPGALASVLLVPQAIAWTLPAALLLAVPMSVGGRPTRGRLTRRTIAMGALFAVAASALVFWIAPQANAWHEAILAPLIQPGATVSQFPNWAAAEPGRLLEYQFHQRLAFGLAALPFALLGLGLSTLATVRRRPWLFGLLAAGAWMFVAFPLELWTSALLLRASTVPPFVLAWMPATLILAAGLMLVARAESSPSAAR
jgi:hypothetical protein